MGPEKDHDKISGEGVLMGRMDPTEIYRWWTAG